MFSLVQTCASEKLFHCQLQHTHSSILSVKWMPIFVRRRIDRATEKQQCLKKCGFWPSRGWLAKARLSSERNLNTEWCSTNEPHEQTSVFIGTSFSCRARGSNPGPLKILILQWPLHHQRTANQQCLVLLRNRLILCSKMCQFYWKVLSMDCLSAAVVKYCSLHSDFFLLQYLLYCQFSH